MADIAAGLPKRRVLAPRLRSFGDDRLGRLAAAGDKRAFAVVYERHHQAIYRYCRSLLGNPDDAADALQDALLSAHRTAGSFRRDAAVSSWLYRIVVNACLDRLRRNKSHPTTELKDDNCAVGDHGPGWTPRSWWNAR